MPADAAVDAFTRAAQPSSYAEYGVLGGLLLVIIWLLLFIVWREKKIGEVITEASRLNRDGANLVADSVNKMSESIANLSETIRFQALVQRISSAMLHDGKTVPKGNGADLQARIEAVARVEMDKLRGV